VVLVEECEELGAVDWQWQAADGAMGSRRVRSGLQTITTLPGVVGRLPGCDRDERPGIGMSVQPQGVQR
jgi:hypothetical protein